ncbi:MAG: zinc ribbon domain-containing protein, partial [Coriobacteriales bacterium]|nr:zinc ribbon domain-containing protein [Coriobacteriales bacterium]
MYCSTCGLPREDGARFCAGCGAPTEPAAPAPSGQPQGLLPPSTPQPATFARSQGPLPASQSLPARPYPAKKSRRTPIIIGTAIAAALLVGAIALVVLFGGGNDLSD